MKHHVIILLKLLLAEYSLSFCIARSIFLSSFTALFRVLLWILVAYNIINIISCVG